MSAEGRKSRIERVLLPTDFSECSARALEIAARVAFKRGWTVDVLHVLEQDGKGVSPEVDRQFAAVLRDIPRDVAEQLHIRFAHGDAAEEIVKVASEGYDLIIMGQNGLGHGACPGSVAREVAAHATCRVMMLQGPSTREQRGVDS